MQDCPVIIHCICYSVYRDLRVINKIADQLARAQQINPWADPATPYSLDNYGVGLLGGATARRGNTPFWFIVRDAISRVQIVYILLRTPLRAVRPGGNNPSVPLEPFFHSELFFFFFQCQILRMFGLDPDQSDPWLLQKKRKRFQHGKFKKKIAMQFRAKAKEMKLAVHMETKWAIYYGN